MPESPSSTSEVQTPKPLPAVLRRALTPMEQNLLRLAQSDGGGVSLILKELSFGSRQEAVSALDAAKAKASRVLARATERDAPVTRTNGHAGGPRSEWPRTTGTVRRREVLDQDADERERARAKREREGVMPARGSILPPEPGEERPLDVVLGEYTEADEPPGHELPSAPAGNMEAGSAAPAPPTVAAEPARVADSTTRTEGPAVDAMTAAHQRPAPDGRARPGARQAKVLDHIREHGPVRQADVRAELGIPSPDMVGIVQRLVDAGEVIRGDLVSRSPMLFVPVTADVIDERGEDAGAGGVSDGAVGDGGDAAGAVETPAAAADGDGGQRDGAGVEGDEAPAAETPAGAAALAPVDDGAEFGTLTREQVREALPHAEPERPVRSTTSEAEARRVLRDVRTQIEASDVMRRALAQDILELGEEMARAADAAVPETLLRARYIAALLTRIEEGNTDPALLDRFERLAGIDGGAGPAV
jgi:hypothetical protein